MTITECRLCRKEPANIQSHVLPEFLYKEVYDKKHRALKITSEPIDGEIVIQKGERDPLLGSNCERLFSKWETFAASIIRNIHNQPIQKSGNYKIIAPIDYDKFKLFQLSILWRMSVSQIQMFNNVNIGTDIEEKLRIMLLSSNPGESYEFGCIILLVKNSSKLPKIIFSPINDNFFGETCIRLQTGDIFWYFLLKPIPINHKLFPILFGNILPLLVFIAPWSEDQIISLIKDEIIKREGKK
jgi:hypothetical protein